MHKNEINSEQKGHSDGLPSDLLAKEQPRPVHARESDVEPPKGVGAKLVGLALLFAIALGIGFFIVSRRRASQESELKAESAAENSAPQEVDVVNVHYAAASHDLQLPGECRAWYETTIYARVNGYLKKWDSDIGDHVKSGQTLATIETPELDQQLAAADAKVKADEAQINLAKATMHFSDVTLARFKDAPKGVVSDLERDEKAADYQTSEAKLGAAESDLVSATAQVDQIRAMIDFQKVVAPFDGIITERRVDIGDLVTAGSTANTTSLFRMAQADNIRVFVDVPETAAPEVHDGDQAMITADEFPGRVFRGKVSRNAGSINNVSKTLRVEVDVPNKDMTLLPGMYVQVNFKINDSHPELEIPASALTFRATGPEVAVVGKDGRVMLKPVKIGRDLGDVVEISKGLESDDQVAMNISDQVVNGDTVKPNLVEEPGDTTPSPHAVTSAAPVSDTEHAH